MPSFLLACLAYLTVALPGSTLGLLWPSMRLSFHEPVGALGILLAFGVAASVVSSATTGRILPRTSVGSLLAVGAVLTAVALAVEAIAPSLWVVAGGFVLFGLGFGSTDAALNVYAAHHFGPRQINLDARQLRPGSYHGPLAGNAPVERRPQLARDVRDDGGDPDRARVGVHHDPPTLGYASRAT